MPIIYRYAKIGSNHGEVIPPIADAQNNKIIMQVYTRVHIYILPYSTLQIWNPVARRIMTSAKMYTKIQLTVFCSGFLQVSCPQRPNRSPLRCSQAPQIDAPFPRSSRTSATNYILTLQSQSISRLQCSSRAAGKSA